MSLKHGIQLVGIGLTVLACFFFLKGVHTNAHTFCSFLDAPLFWLPLIGIVYVLAAFSLSLAWYRLFGTSRQNPLSVKQWVAINFFAQFGKYIPGNVAHQFGRAYLAKKNGIPVRHTLALSVFETLLALIVSAILFCVLILHGTYIHTSISPIYAFILPVFAIVYFLPFTQKKLNNIYQYILRRFNQLETEYHSLPDTVSQLIAMMFYFLNFFLLGFILYLVSKVYLGNPDISAIYLTCAFASAWMIGFVTPGAPAGIGLREFVLVYLLVPVLGEAASFQAAIYMRVISLLGDGFCFLIGAVLLKDALPTKAR